MGHLHPRNSGCNNEWILIAMTMMMMIIIIVKLNDDDNPCRRIHRNHDCLQNRGNDEYL